jgi:hypothetical protein
VSLDDRLPQPAPNRAESRLHALSRATVSGRGVASALADRRLWIRRRPSSSPRHSRGQLLRTGHRGSDAAPHRHSVTSSQQGPLLRTGHPGSDAVPHRHIVTSSQQGAASAVGSPWIRRCPSSSQRHIVTAGTASADLPPWIRRCPSSSQRHIVTVVSATALDPTPSLIVTGVKVAKSTQQAVEGTVARRSRLWVIRSEPSGEACSSINCPLPTAHYASA